MSASNFNWVCFRCRFAARQPKTARTVPKCSGCGGELHCLGCKVEPPRRTDVRAWRKLHLESRRRLLAWSDRQAVRRVRVAHVAEWEAVRPRALAQARGRRKTVRRLKNKARADRAASNRAG